jgi:hypothetical protein
MRRPFGELAHETTLQMCRLTIQVLKQSGFVTQDIPQWAIKIDAQEAQEITLRHADTER